MTSPRWIGPDESLQLNDFGFLIRHSNACGVDSYHLRATPAKTNQSYQETLVGWCGSYNGISTFAEGMAKVIRVAKNHRVLVQEIEGEALKAALEELGYPELYPGEAQSPS